MDSVNPKLVEVYRARTSLLAHSLRVALEAEGIPSYVDGDYLQSAVGELPYGAIAPRIMVMEADESRARAILAESEHALSDDNDDQASNATESELTEHVECLVCGASMDDQETCPECGWSYRPDEGHDSE
ncbi:MAG: DUF2007 domain-containing protein [Planctomycetota bacterium]|nr:DUF2007 domain-containing protein [Planctomycetota bacterium]MDA1212333.1 DUF2007 domain-containing protein [Planctomycetota bacterium]